MRAHDNTHGRSSCFPWRFYQASSTAAIGGWLADGLLVLYGLLRFGQNMPMHMVVLGLFLGAAVFGGWRLWLMARLQRDCSAVKGWRGWLYSECLLSAVALLAALLVLSAVVSRLFFENLPLMD